MVIVTSSVLLFLAAMPAAFAHQVYQEAWVWNIQTFCLMNHSGISFDGNPWTTDTHAFAHENGSMLTATRASTTGTSPQTISL